MIKTGIVDAELVFMLLYMIFQIFRIFKFNVRIYFSDFPDHT